MVAIQKLKRRSDGSSTLLEWIDIALAGNGKRSVHRKKLAVLGWPHLGRDYDTREVVTALDNEHKTRMFGCIWRGVIQICNDTCESEG